MVGNALLWDVRALKSVVIPGGVQTIGNYWFSNSDIENVTISASVMEIGIEAFCGCHKLKRVIFSDDIRLEQLDDFCFYKSGLTEMILPPSVRHVGVKAFCGCEELKTLMLNEGLETIGESAFEHTGLDDVTVPGTVERLSDSVFRDCTNL